MTEWTKEEDEAFNEVEKNSNLGKQILRELGQPYHFDVYVSVSQRNQVLDEAANMCDELWQNDGTAYDCREAIRKMKK
jgi:hypothetical protein